MTHTHTHITLTHTLRTALFGALCFRSPSHTYTHHPTHTHTRTAWQRVRGGAGESKWSEKPKGAAHFHRCGWMSVSHLPQQPKKKRTRIEKEHARAHYTHTHTHSRTVVVLSKGRRRKRRLTRSYSPPRELPTHPHPPSLTLFRSPADTQIESSGEQCRHHPPSRFTRPQPQQRASTYSPFFLYILKNNNRKQKRLQRVALTQTDYAQNKSKTKKKR